MFQFNRNYLILTLLLFITEVLIALYAHDQFIRPYVGDFLVVILLYCFVKSFLNVGYVRIGLSVLVFSYFIETGQHFHLVHLLGLDNSKLAVVVMGNYFAWMDLVAYTLGILTVLGIEKMRTRSRLQSVSPVN